MCARACARVPFFLPAPSVRVYSSFLWAPGQTLLFIFLGRGSNESHMQNGHFSAFCTLPAAAAVAAAADSPPLKDGQSRAFSLAGVAAATVSRSPPLFFFLSPAATSPARRLPPDAPEQRGVGCQSKQAARVKKKRREKGKKIKQTTRAHLARLRSRDRDAQSFNQINQLIVVAFHLLNP